ncbi:MAG TPA: glycosyltransferase N-terminal domain-containing protein [Candidatus Polarisedimenticolaceae bacterium]
MILSLYDVAASASRALAWVWAAWASRSAAGAREWDERLVRILPAVPPGSIWIHGASLGEARLSAILAGELRARLPGTAVVVSALTPAGRAALPGPPKADAAFYFPIDARPLQRRLLDALRPSAIVLVETELWPSLLREAASARVPVVIANARLSPERMTRYRRLESLYRPLLGGIAAIAAAGEADASRLLALGAPAARTAVAGNLKFDLPAPTLSRREVRAALGWDASIPVVAAGSTGEGEDGPVLDAFLRLRTAHPDARLVLAPRHAERFDAAEREAASRGLLVHRLSRGERAAPDAAILLVDGLGRLATLYAAADAAFVGGSLVPVGGHNLLEPAAAGVPVLFGPHTHHVAEMAQVLEAEGAALRVTDAGALGDAWERLIDDPDARARQAAAAERVMERHRGALDRTVDRILGVLA